MKAVLTAVIAAIEAVAVALAGLAVIAVPVLLMWWLAFSLDAEPEVLASAVAEVWLIAHLVPITFAVTAEMALGFGLAPEPFLFTLSLAPLGLTLLTVLLGVRTGWRFAQRGGAGVAGVLGGAIGFGGAASAVVLIGAPRSPWPSWLEVLVPVLCYGLAAAAGFVVHAARLGHPWWLAGVRGLLRRLEWVGELRAAALPGRAVETLRIAAGVFAGLLGLGALGVAVALVVGHIEVITLSQALQLDLLGQVMLLLLNIVLLPVLCIWAVAWFSGAGFAIGTATSVTPFETLLGPLPALPLFGAVPQGWGWAGGLAPALVVLLGVVIGAFAGGRPEIRRSSITACLVMPVVAAALAGLAIAGLAALATGAIGPGRLAESGPQPWLVGALVALELAIGLVPGLLARRLDSANRLRDATATRLAQLRERGEGEGTAVDPAAGSFDPGVDPAVDPNAETQPITHLERVIEMGAQSQSQSQSQAGAGALAQAETVELMPIDSEAFEAATPEHTPVLPSHPLRPPAAEPVPPGSADPDPAPAEGDASADELLRAFSWENARDAGPADGDEPSGWRRPWRRR